MQIICPCTRLRGHISVDSIAIATYLDIFLLYFFPKNDLQFFKVVLLFFSTSYQKIYCQERRCIFAGLGLGWGWIYILEHYLRTFLLANFFIICEVLIPVLPIIIILGYFLRVQDFFNVTIFIYLTWKNYLNIFVIHWQLRYR